MAKLKIGVFGGYRGHTMINVLFNHDDAELVAVCDKYEPILEGITREAEARNMTVATYTDFEEFIKHDMDAVVLANYATEHLLNEEVSSVEVGTTVSTELLCLLGLYRRLGIVVLPLTLAELIRLKVYVHKLAVLVIGEAITLHHTLLTVDHVVV